MAFRMAFRMTLRMTFRMTFPATLRATLPVTLGVTSCLHPCALRRHERIVLRRRTLALPIARAVLSRARQAVSDIGASVSAR